eukprot:tig00000663_g2946.t1
MATHRSRKLPPWAPPEGYTLSDGRLCLHNEILDFVQYVSGTEEDRKSREELVERVRQVLLGLWPSSEVKVFGSFATDLFLPTSDIDLVVFGCGSSPLKRASEALGRKAWVSKMQVIGKARVPIVKFVDTETGVPVDICFGQESGPQNVPFIREHIEKMPALRPLIVVMKYFLLQRALNETYTGGIGSYLLFVICVSHLQLHPAYNTGARKDRVVDLGTLLADFFLLYGRSFNYQTTGISIRDGGSYMPRSERAIPEDGRPVYFWCEDPTNTENDLGRGAFGLAQVRRAFEHAHRTLTAGVDEFTRANSLVHGAPPADTILSRVRTPRPAPPRPALRLELGAPDTGAADHPRGRRARRAAGPRPARPAAGAGPQAGAPAPAEEEDDDVAPVFKRKGPAPAPAPAAGRQSGGHAHSAPSPSPTGDSRDRSSRDPRRSRPS